jgi:hypothetical protein
MAIMGFKAAYSTVVKGIGIAPNGAVILMQSRCGIDVVDAAALLGRWLL